MSDAPASAPSGAAVAVVVVSDFATAGDASWSDERAALAGWQRQDLDEPFEILLVAPGSARATCPADLAAGRPRVRVLHAREEASAPRKDLGARATAAEFVAVVEADCVPEPDWLRRALAALRSHPECCAVSGRTTYGEETALRRVFGLVDRSFDDLVAPGYTPHVSNNAALLRHSTLLRHPYPDAATPFLSSRWRLSAMRQAGERFWFEPAARVRHRFDGLSFVRDVRRNVGYSDVAEHAPRRWRDLPGIWWRRRRFEAGNMRRCRDRLRWHDLPLLALLYPVAALLEIPGMVDALRGRREIPGTAFR